MYRHAGDVSGSSVILTAFAVFAFFYWFARRGEGVDSRYRAGRGDVDREVLEQAEREVRDLDTSVDPDDGFEGDEWGPGAPK